MSTNIFSYVSGKGDTEAKVTPKNLFHPEENFSPSPAYHFCLAYIEVSCKVALAEHPSQTITM
jgi:hypothetical protein